jgi:hypothetical protein
MLRSPAAARTWAPGETGLKTASMNIVGNLVGEATETFDITIALGPGPTSGTIT